MTECGAPCKALCFGQYGEQRFAAHLEFLKLSIPAVGKSVLGEAYKAAGYRGKTRNALNAGASRLLHTVKMQAALRWHHDQDSEKYAATKERAIQRLNALAEHATLENFASIDDKVVVVKNWDELSSDQIRGAASIEQRPDGTIKIKVRDPVAADRLLADLLGWKEAEKEDQAIVAESEARTRLLEMLARRAGAEEKELRALRDECDP